MGNTIVIMILIAVAALALLRTRKHFKGGGCCGSGSNTIRTQKKLTGTVIGQKTLTIEGMHCENCQARIENAINRIDGVACQVNLRKKPPPYLTLWKFLTTSSKQLWRKWAIE